MNEIGFALKNARENKELTQKKVMELTGINSKTLSGYENNISEPDLNTFACLMDLYGTSADEILKIKPSQETPQTRNEKQLLSLFRKLDKTHQNELLIQLNALVKYRQT